MKTKPLYYITNGSEYLDAYNGGNEWEWTGIKARAWQMQLTRAETYLQYMAHLFPKAQITPANKSAQQSA